MATVWLFINSTWTAGKHPAESPYGQPLNWGDNAFTTLNEAVSYAKSHGLSDVQFVDYDKSVLLTNTNNIVKKLSSKEIKGTYTSKTAGAAATYTEESKQSGSGKLAVDTFNQNAALAGFKDVVIKDGTGKFTVTGGNNNVKHIYTSNIDNSFKDSGSVTGKADGTLTLQGGNVTSAGGAWAEVRGPINDYTDITTNAEALEVADIGYAGDYTWSWPDSSVLVKLPGYAAVTISEWGSAGMLVGGTLNYTHLTDAAYANGSYTNVTKNYSQSVGAAGKLTVYTGTVDSAYRYATIDVYNGGEFGKLYGGNAVNSAKTTYKETAGKNDSTTKITFEDVANYTAAGAFTANNLGNLGSYKRDVDGYAKVTVANTELGDLGAANEKYTSKMTSEAVTPKGLGDSRTTISYSYTATYAAGGTLVTAKGNTSAKFGDVSGFNKVDLTSATVSGDIEIAGGGSGRPGSESTFYSEVSSGTKLMQSKNSDTSSFAAAGAVTLTEAVVTGKITGAATVKLADTTVSNSIIAGKYSDNSTSSFVLTPDKTYPWASTTTNTRTQKYNAGGAGTLTMNGGKLVNAYKLEDFATVTLDKVGGSITTVYGFSSSIDDSNTEKYDWPDAHTSMQVFGESKCTETTTAAGTFTATGKGGLVINYIRGANKATLNSVTVKNGIYAGTSKNVTNTRMTYDYKNMTAAISFTTTENDNAAGTLSMKEGTLSGYVSGYQNVTFDAVAGPNVVYIEGGSSATESSGSSFNSGSLPVSAFVSSKTTYTAAGALVMKDCNYMKIKNINGFAKVEMTGPIVSSSITGGNDAEVTTSREVIDGKTGRLSTKFDWSSSSTLTGSAGLTDVIVSGSVVGYATVTLDSNSNVSAWAVGSDGGNVTSAEHHYADYKGSTTLTGVLKSDYLDKFSDTAVGTLTLKNGAYVVNAAGVKTATLTNATAVGCTIAMKTSSHSNSRTVVSNAKTGLYESRQIDLYKGTAAGTAVIDAAMVGMDYGDLGSDCITGVAKLTANYAFLATVGGYNSDYCYSNCKIDTVFSSRSESYSSNAVGNFTLTSTTAGDLYGASTVKLTDAQITGAYASNGKTSDSYSSAATNFSSSYNYSSYAAGNFTASENSEIGSNGARGYQNVTMNDVTITGGGDVEGGKYVNTFQSSWTKDSATGPYRTFASAGSQSKQALGKATLTHVQNADASYINGFATVVLDSATDAGGVNNFFSSYDSKYDYKLEYDKTGKLTKQAYSSGRSSFAKTELTLKNGASVKYSVNGVKTLNVAAGCTIGGSVGMRESKYAATYNITSNAKTNLYEGKRKVESSYTDVGTVNVTGGQLSHVYGAAKVTATDAVLGDVTEYGNRYSSECTAQGPKIYSAGGTNYIDESKAVLLSSYLTSQTIAVGQATLTRTTAQELYNIANVKLNDAAVKRAQAVNEVVTETYDYKNGKLDHKRTSVSDVTGTLTATDATFTDTGAAVARYATVTLTDCDFTGNGRIVGGRSETVLSGSVSGYTNYGDARTALSDDTTTTNTVAGKLTATRSTLGAIWSYAAVALTDCTALEINNEGDRGKSTLTLAGDNVITGTVPYSIRKVTDVTVKDGSTTLNKQFSGGDADNTVTVNAKAEFVAKGTVSFGYGNDSLTVNGAFRACAGFYQNELEKLSGSGLFALTNTNCKNVLDAIKNGNIKKSGNLEIVAAGEKAGDVLAIRTKKEELADNTAKTARKHYSGTTNGWLSYEEAPDLGKFADTEDWISFKYEGSDYKVTLTDNTRYADLTVEIYDGKSAPKTVVWNSTQKAFNLTGLSAGTDYQLHLAIKSGKKAMSYALSSPMG